jgi:hypothetical protein
MLTAVMEVERQPYDVDDNQNACCTAELVGLLFVPVRVQRNTISTAAAELMA